MVRMLDLLPGERIRLCQAWLISRYLFCPNTFRKKGKSCERLGETRLHKGSDQPLCSHFFVTQQDNKRWLEMSQLPVGQMLMQVPWLSNPCDFWDGNIAWLVGRKYILYWVELSIHVNVIYEPITSLTSVMAIPQNIDVFIVSKAIRGLRYITNWYPAFYWLRRFAQSLAKPHSHRFLAVKVLFVDNLLNNKTIILLNLASYIIWFYATWPAISLA